MRSSGPVELAVKPAVFHPLRQDKVDHGTQGLFPDSEVTGVVQKHAVDAHIAFPVRMSGIDAAILFLQCVGDHFYRFLYERMLLGKPDVFKIQQRVVGTSPFGIIKPVSPMPVWFSSV